MTRTAHKLHSTERAAVRQYLETLTDAEREDVLTGLIPTSSHIIVTRRVVRPVAVCAACGAPEVRSDG
jgi:hypothetical protein